MSCKPGVPGLIPGFSIKTTFGEPLGVPVIKPTQILNQPGGTGLFPGKPQKGIGTNLCLVNQGSQVRFLASP